MAEKQRSVLDDIKDVKGYIAGVIAFAVALGSFCSGVFGWAPGKVTAVASVCSFLAISLAVLIQRAENRNIDRLAQHIEASNKLAEKDAKCFEYLKGMALENQRSSIRLEMNALMRDEPENHDTILAYAEKYFLELDGDWKQTDRFLSWVDAETEAGRKVHIPPALSANVGMKSELEKNTTR